MFKTLSQTSPGFYVSVVQVLKTRWEKEKLFITSNFSFSHSFFHTFGKILEISITFKNCRLQTLSVWESLKFVVWERVNTASLTGPRNFQHNNGKRKSTGALHGLGYNVENIINHPTGKNRSELKNI